MREEWAPLAARIRGLVEASHLAARLFTTNSDSLGVIVDLGAHASAILSDLLSFGSSLDVAQGYASGAITRVAVKAGPMLADKSSSSEMRQIYVRSAIVMIGALEGEITYLLRDADEFIRSRTERAFEHLSRSIVVDDDIRGKWQKALGNGEVACERLGAVHLLAHGIWAFKVDAIGGRTDLVFQEPIVDMASIRRSGEGLVLTEWKVLTSGADPLKQYGKAIDQCRSYSEGVLAGTELSRYRYAVVVSDENVATPDDVEFDRVVYRHINIAVNPKTPSKRHFS